MSYIKGSEVPNASKYFLCAINQDQDRQQVVPVLTQQTTRLMFTNSGMFIGGEGSLQAEQEFSLNNNLPVEINVFPLIDLDRSNNCYYVVIRGELHCYYEDDSSTFFNVSKKLYLPTKKYTTINVSDVSYDDNTKTLTVVTNVGNAVFDVPENTNALGYDLMLCSADMSEVELFTDTIPVECLAEDSNGTCLFTANNSSLKLYCCTDYDKTHFQGPLYISTQTNTDTLSVPLNDILRILPPNTTHVVFEITPSKVLTYGPSYVNVTSNVCLIPEDIRAGIVNYFKPGYIAAELQGDEASWLNTGHVTVTSLCDGPDGWCINKEADAPPTYQKITFWDIDCNYVCGIRYEEIDGKLTAQQIRELLYNYPTAKSAVCNCFIEGRQLDNNDVVYAYRTALDGTTLCSVGASNGHMLVNSIDTVKINTDSVVTPDIDEELAVRFTIGSGNYTSPLNYASEQDILAWNDTLFDMPVFFDTKWEHTPAYLQFVIQGNTVVLCANYENMIEVVCRWPISGAPIDLAYSTLLFADKHLKVPRSFLTWLHANTIQSRDVSDYYVDYSNCVFKTTRISPFEAMDWIDSSIQLPYIESIHIPYYSVELNDKPRQLNNGERNIAIGIVADGGIGEGGYVHVIEDIPYSDIIIKVDEVIDSDQDQSVAITMGGTYVEDVSDIFAFRSNGFLGPDNYLLTEEHVYYFNSFSEFAHFSNTQCDIYVNTQFAFADVVVQCVYKGIHRTVTIPEGVTDYCLTVDCGTNMTWACTAGLFFQTSPWSEKPFEGGKVAELEGLPPLLDGSSYYVELLND